MNDSGRFGMMLAAVAAVFLSIGTARAQVNWQTMHTSNPTTSLAVRAAGLADPAQWKIERMRGGALIVRVPGMALGQSSQVELFDLAGKRASYWGLRSAEGAIAFGDGSLQAGAYLLKVRIAGIQGVKRIAI